MDDVREAAEATLVAAGVLGPTWALDGVEAHGDGVRVVLQREDGVRIGLTWVEPAGEPVRAYRQGPRYAASTGRGPGLIDVDGEGAAADVRAVALRACEALAALSAGPPLGGSPGAGTIAPLPLSDAAPEEPITGLAASLRLGVQRDLGTDALPNPEGWELDDVCVVPRWTRVAEVLLSRADRTLAFIVAPRDPDRPAYARTASWDVVYYSDDLPVERHGELYARDRDTIERVAAWLRAVDPGAHRGG